MRRRSIWKGSEENDKQVLHRGLFASLFFGSGERMFVLFHPNPFSLISAKLIFCETFSLCENESLI